MPLVKTTVRLGAEQEAWLEEKEGTEKHRHEYDNPR